MKTIHGIQPFDMAPSKPMVQLLSPKPFTPPAILHELALETRTGSALGVDPVEEILDIPTK
ncbi:MAG: hypothetical protein KBG20_14565 [Caldilineaceae bacterium]|nr:hypothetical protein [Caldilineaceae bacterium]MBP8108369.1 hypothetical protein [Caldilineaceae bacterium]MBP8123294.1 hypothetical protein [Caldilineaceae bacterium]MBP9073526.1 hypothetical protein [Caldilineaceae bacterium]